MTYLVTGATYNYREVLSDMGGKWDAANKSWRLPASADRDKLNRMVGCVVRNETPPEPFGMPDEKPQRVIDRIGKTNIHGDDPTYLNYFAGKNPIAFFGFSNLEALVSFAESVKPSDHVTWTAGQGSTKTHTFKEAVKLARNGWSEGIDKAQEIVEVLDVEHALQQKRKYDVAGGRVNVGRMLSGHPLHMIKREKQPGRKNITIFVETAINAAINADKAVIRAACIASMIDVLEIQGYSCEVIATNMTDDGIPRKPAEQLACRIKSSGEKLNLSDMVFALGHPSFERRFNFACVMSDPALKNTQTNMGYSGVAFDDENIVGSNEFYISTFNAIIQRQIKGDTLREQALSLLPHLIPDGLPISLDA